MKNQTDTMITLKIMRRWLPVLTIAILTIIAACTAGGVTGGNEQARQEADSLIRANRNIDSLPLLAERFARAGNVAAEIAAYRELGKCLREDSRFPEAIDIHKKALQLAVQTSDTLQIIQTLNEIGTNYRRLGMFDEATDYHYQALAHCDSYSDKESLTSCKNRVVSLNGIGNIHLMTGNYAEADSVLRQALAGERGLGSALGQAINYANIGSIFEDKDQLDSARHYYSLSMHFNQEAGSNLGVALCRTHFGRLYEKDRDYDAAIGEYRQAYDLMERTSDTWHWLNACLALARVHLEKRELAAAGTYTTRAKQAAEQIHSPEHLADAYNLEYQLNKLQGNNAAALESFVKSKDYADSLMNSQSMERMQNVRLAFERRNKENEIALLQQSYDKERALQRMMLFAALATLILACIAIVAMWYVIRLRAQKQQIRQQAEQMRTNFFTNITHEFRTPLTVIESAANSMLQRLPADYEEQREDLKHILHHERNLLRLINQILDIAKFSSGKMQLPGMKRGDVVGFIHLICDSYKAYAAQKGIQLTYAPHEKEVVMDFVPDYIQTMLSNLISNAIKHSHKACSVLVYTELRPGGKICFGVKDTGQGMTAEQQANAFMPFYQGDSDSRHIGTGIGLSLVKYVVEAMGGSIGLQSAPGEGSSFTIDLPLKSKTENVESLDLNHVPSLETVSFEQGTALPLDSASNAPLAKDDGEGVRVLVVEDTPEVAHYMVRQLNAQYNYYFADNGLDGLKRAEELVPDIIITDIMMPGIDGFELCRQVRASQLLNHIPVVMVTAKITPEDRLQGLEAGADAYLEKPFRADELNVRVEKLLEQRRLLRQKFSALLQQEADGRPAEKQPDEQNADKLNPVDEANKLFMLKLTDIVQAVIAQGKIDYDALAYKLCLSRAQLNRKVKAITGYTTTEFILQRRIALAKLLLDTTDSPVWEVAMKCGMENDTYFATLFKKCTDMTPTQYRNR